MNTNKIIFHLLLKTTTFCQCKTLSTHYRIRTLESDTRPSFSYDWEKPNCQIYNGRTTRKTLQCYTREFLDGDSRINIIQAVTIKLRGQYKKCDLLHINVYLNCISYFLDLTANVCLTTFAYMFFRDGQSRTMSSPANTDDHQTQ